jgi:hypothetical protein
MRSLVTALVLLVLLRQFGTAQERMLQGKIVNGEDGTPIGAASIAIDETGVRAISDEAGRS